MHENYFQKIFSILKCKTHNKRIKLVITPFKIDKVLKKFSNLKKYVLESNSYFNHIDIVHYTNNIVTYNSLSNYSDKKYLIFKT